VSVEQDGAGNGRADLRPIFRAVGKTGSRRALRLERVFWKTLRAMAKANHTSIAFLVEELASGEAALATNLSSAIRAACADWLSDEAESLSRIASLATVNSILAACPSPAFALSASKAILSFNAPFQQFVRRQLPFSPTAENKNELRLALDMSVKDVFDRLEGTHDKPVSSGFAIGAGERRFRGQLNLVRAPVRQPPVLLAFVA
jgi:predicted DNA-binding ribbon-helix-helix protein